MLSHRGVEITDELQVVMSDELRTLYESSPFQKDVPALTVAQGSCWPDPDQPGKGLQGRIARVLAARRAVELHSQAAESQQKALLAASGESVGQAWTTPPTSKKDAWQNLWLQTALRQRLHTFTFPTGTLCSVRRAEGAEELCLAPLTQEHIYNCQAGCARFRKHKHVLGTLAHLCRADGAFVDVERFCADLGKRQPNGSLKEAWLDVCAQWPGDTSLWRMDVTIRSPWADYGRAALRPGLAADAGVRAKAARYGETVLAVSFEPLGRLATASVDGLWRAAAVAASRRQGLAAGSVYRRWRLTLERALLWATAEQGVVAAGHGASAPRWR